jgi:hypothetical protein
LQRTTFRLILCSMILKAFPRFKLGCRVEKNVKVEILHLGGEWETFSITGLVVSVYAPFPTANVLIFDLVFSMAHHVYYGSFYSFLLLCYVSVISASYIFQGYGNHFSSFSLRFWAENKHIDGIILHELNWLLATSWVMINDIAFSGYIRFFCFFDESVGTCSTNLHHN